MHIPIILRTASSETVFPSLLLVIHTYIPVSSGTGLLIVNVLLVTPVALPRSRSPPSIRFHKYVVSP